MKFNLPKEKSSIIKVIGVGGGGGNAVNHMHEQGIKGVDFIICNTDLQALEASAIPNKIQLGASLTQGLGAGANPEVGKKAAMEAIEDIIDMLGVNTKMLFITAGMGGGTGTGAAPIIAKTAKEMDILTVGIVTTPFNFEGKKRKTFADEGLENLKRSVDCLLIISNDKIKDMYGNLALREAFGHANNILTTAAKGIAEIITHPGYINVDFEDVKTVMKSSGVALMGSAMAEGEDRALVAVKAALASPLLNDNQIVGAKNILLNISSGTEEILMEEFEQISAYIQNESGLSAELILGTSFDESLGNKISVTLIATGFESKPRENKVIIGSTIADDAVQSSFVNKPTVIETKPEIVQVVQTTPNAPMSNSVEVKPIEKKVEDTIRINLIEDELPQQEIELDNELGFGLRIDAIKEDEVANAFESNHIDLKIDESYFINSTEEVVEDDYLVVNENIFEDKIETTNHAIVPKVYQLSDEMESNSLEQDKKIERQIQRIKELKNLNITINNPQGLRDLEKEPAYIRRNKKLDDVPHSSEKQISRLSLFEDLVSGKSEIKTNNSFLHDNVD
ncbi:MAG: cell division protein FtsZ [Bacteroidia bacterium]|nr:cell division protein FtsZ [Bacteroidia bacterium]